MNDKTSGIIFAHDAPAPGSHYFILARFEAPAAEMGSCACPGWPGILLHEAIGHGLEADFHRQWATSAWLWALVACGW